jgi:hypothetical protein
MGRFRFNKALYPLTNGLAEAASEVIFWILPRDHNGDRKRSVSDIRHNFASDDF